MGIGCFPPKRLQFRKNHRAVRRQRMEERAETAAGSTLTYLLLWIIVRSCAESGGGSEAPSGGPETPVDGATAPTTGKTRTTARAA